MKVEGMPAALRSLPAAGLCRRPLECASLPFQDLRTHYIQNKNNNEP